MIKIILPSYCRAMFLWRAARFIMCSWSSYMFLLRFSVSYLLSVNVLGLLSSNSDSLFRTSNKRLLNSLTLSNSGFLCSSGSMLMSGLLRIDLRLILYVLMWLWSYPILFLDALKLSTCAWGATIYLATVDWTALSLFLCWWMPLIDLRPPGLRSTARKPASDLNANIN